MHRITQVKFTLLIQLHRRDGRYGLRHGVNTEEVVPSHWRIVINTAITDGLKMNNFTIAHHQIDHAWHSPLSNVL